MPDSSPTVHDYVEVIENREKGRYDAARAWLMERLAGHPGDARAIAHLARVDMLQGQDAAAAANLACAQGIAPADPFVLSVRARLALKAQKVSDAAASIAQALAVEPGNPEYQVVQASVLRTLGERQRARYIVDKVLAADPNHAEALVNRAQLHISERSYDAAAADTVRALALKPHVTELWKLLAGINLQAGRSAEAMEALERYCRYHKTDAPALSDLGELLRRHNRVDDALAVLRQAVDVEPGFAGAWLHYGNALQKARNLRGAEAAYEKALALVPGAVEVHHNLGSVLLDLGKFDAAVASLRRAVAIKADLVEAWITLGIALAKQRNVQEALAAADAAQRCNPQSPSAMHALGVLLARCGRLQEARAHFEACLQRDPEDRLGAGWYLSALGFAAIPGQTPDSLLERLYADRARSWDEGAKGQFGYRGADLVAEAYRKTTRDRRIGTVLDAGCGTGLVGLELRGLADALHGVDFSAPMLAKAKEKGVYHELHEGDLVTYMAGREERYDVIVSAATLIHFGDLGPPLHAAARALRPDGLFIFTLFPREPDDSDFAIGDFDGRAQGGCFAHSPFYVRRLAAQVGLSLQAMYSEV